MNKLIGTHNSITGEKGNGFISWLVSPFSITQSKTIKEQLEAGVTMFDIRCKYNKSNVLIGAHGLWTSKRTIQSILKEINDFGKKVIINLTYEGEYVSNWEHTCFDLVRELNNIRLYYINVKYPKWTVLSCFYDMYKDEYPDVEFGKSENAFTILDGRSWHTYFPCPILWKYIYHRNVTFSDKYWTIVDFI